MSHLRGRTRVVSGLLALALIGGSSGQALAHPGHPHHDGRIPRFPDFKRVGDDEFRFHSDKGMYSHKRNPEGKAMWFHADFPPAYEGFSYDLPTTAEPVVCATSGHRIRVVYASTANPATPTPSQVDGIRGIVRRMNWKIMSESLRSSGESLWPIRMRVDCDASGQIRVHTLTAPSGYIYDIWPAVDSQLGKPTGANAVKNLIFFAGADPLGAWGYGGALNDSLKSSSDASTGNDNRITTTSATIYNPPSVPGLGVWRTHTALHELFHAMGAVQPGAPFRTSAYHCTDGIDTMCYSDGSPEAPNYSETHCSDGIGYGSPNTVPLDCGYDSYFDSLEESGEWLSTHWNVGGQENPYLVASPPPAPTCDPLTRSRIKTGDVNGDGRDDIFRFTDPGDAIGAGQVWRSNGSSFTSLGQVGAGFGVAYQDRLVDRDGDGDHDILQFTEPDGPFRGGVWGWTSNGSSYTSLGQVGTSFPHPCEVRIGDMNGDGLDDIFRFTSIGNGYAWRATVTGNTYLGLIGREFGLSHQMRFVDMDGDGDDDIFTFLDSGDAYAWRSDRSTYTSLGLIGRGFGSADEVRVGDRDADGDDDLFRFSDAGNGYYWRSNGTSYTSLGLFTSGFGPSRQVRIADINGDSKADILWFFDDGTAYAWHGDGRGFASLGQIGSGFGVP